VRPPAQVRLKLHIVARHMYMEVQLPGLAPRGAARGGLAALGGGGLARGAAPPRLSDRAKEVGRLPPLCFATYCLRARA
jgi:hypothetical protein